MQSDSPWKSFCIDFSLRATLPVWEEMLALGPEQVIPKSTIRPRRFHNGSYEYHRELFLSNNDDKHYSLASEWSKTV